MEGVERPTIVRYRHQRDLPDRVSLSVTPLEKGWGGSPREVNKGACSLR